MRNESRFVRLESDSNNQHQESISISVKPGRKKKKRQVFLMGGPALNMPLRKNGV